MGRTVPLTSKRCFLYIYSTNIGTEYFKHALYAPFFFSSKCSLFYNADFFGSCTIHVLYTGCAKIKKKKIRCQRVKGLSCAWIRSLGILFGEITHKHVHIKECLQITFYHKKRTACLMYLSLLVVKEFWNKDTICNIVLARLGVWYSSWENMDESWW